MTAELCD